MVFFFILNPSFIDMTFQVKQLLAGDMLDRASLHRLRVAVFFNPAALMGPMAFWCWQIPYVSYVFGMRPCFLTYLL